MVALTALVFAMRFCLLVLVSALSPDAAAAAGLTSLCQPSGQQQTLPGLHDPLACHCGPVCAHGCALQSGLSGAAALPVLLVPATTIKRPVAGRDDVHPPLIRSAAIRGPPLSLI
ncbi:hypothetical protein DCO57_03645 [Labrenzia sp. 011]|nr:hypothetical protein DCO57_03645 [Labrenzia sp. 011]